jgi:ribonuclease P/MRP protein subunit POP5
VKVEKHRYVAFEIITRDDTITKDELLKTIWSQLYSLYGEYWTSKIGLWLIHFDPQSKKGVLRCSLEEIDKLRTVLATITNFKRKREAEAIIHVLGISGTLKTIKEKYVFFS